MEDFTGIENQRDIQGRKGVSGGYHGNDDDDGGSDDDGDDNDDDNILTITVIPVVRTMTAMATTTMIFSPLQSIVHRSKHRWH